MKTLQLVASVLIVALGLVHCGFTFHSYEGLSYEAVWFLGIGVAIVMRQPQVFVGAALFLATTIYHLSTSGNRVLRIGRRWPPPHSALVFTKFVVLSATSL
ncbi:MAG: hypothetical protein ABR530_10225 [Pyrinomonadaceae bacterium]